MSSQTGDTPEPAHDAAMAAETPAAPSDVDGGSDEKVGESTTRRLTP